MDKMIADLFLQRTGLHLLNLSSEDSTKVWRRKGEVYRHALLKVREHDPLAVAPAMVEELRQWWRTHQNPKLLFPTPGRGWADRRRLRTRGRRV